jgi:hypothetical protein
MLPAPCARVDYLWGKTDLRAALVANATGGV